MPDSEQANPAPVEMQRICLDFQRHKDRYAKYFERFVERHKARLSLENSESPAAEIIDRLFPVGVPGGMIVKNITLNGKTHYLIRPVAEGPQAETYAAGNLAPAFRAYARNGHLVITGFEDVPHVPPRAYERVISGLIHHAPSQEAMNADDLKQLEALPSARKEAQRRIEPQEEFLNWMMAVVKAMQPAFRYDHIEAVGEETVRFYLVGRHHPQNLRRQLSRSTLSAADLSASRSPDRWDPPPDSKHRYSKLGELIEIEPIEGDVDLTDQTHAAANKETHVSVTCRLPDNISEGDLPRQGFLLSHIGGELKPLINQAKALKRFALDKGYHPNLDCLFGIKNAAVPDWIPDVLARFPDLRLNPAQREAVIKALAASDIFVLHGPPGTGKTEVIAWICRIVLESGGRVLLSSQTNTAVDNVLTRLDDEIEVRPLRVAREDRVEAATKQFLPDNAPGVLVGKAVRDCRRRLQSYRRQQQRIQDAERGLEVLRRLWQQIGELLRRRTETEERLTERRATRQTRTADLDAARDQVRALQTQRRAISDLSEWLEAFGSEPPKTATLGTENIAAALAGCASELLQALSGMRWPPSWLPTAAPSSMDACLLLIHQARQVSQELIQLEAPILEAITLCRQGAGGGDDANSARLRELEAEKQQLMDSEDSDDLLRVARINQELKALRGEKWSSVCRGMMTALRNCFQGAVPEQIDTVVASLKPDPAHVATLQELQSFLASFRHQVDQTLQEATPGIVNDCRRHNEAMAEQAEAMELDATGREMDLDVLEQEIVELEFEAEESDARLQELEARWREEWPDTCLEDPATEAPAPSDQSLQDRQNAFNTWLQTHEDELSRQRQWLPILEEWIKRIDDPQEAQRPYLRAIYKKHANVVGATCTEAGQRNFWDQPDFEGFDVVLVDETSKVTPPELIEAALLGRKLIIVGDHRQLPPHWKEHDFTFEEAAADGLLNPDDVNRFREIVTSSLFQQLYEDAPEALRQTLLVQYRMHSRIMAVVNLFYDGLLKAGPDEQTLDKRRQHHLRVRDRRGGWFLEPHQQVLWVDSTNDTRGRPFYERQCGTSKVNLLEARLIEASLLRVNQALVERGYRGQQETTATQAEAGLSCRAFVERVLGDVPGETIDDLFAHDRIKLNGRAARADDIVTAGQQLMVDARRSVAVITFYGAQLGEIRRRLQQTANRDSQAFSAIDLNSNTVDRFQGMEAPIVLVSLVRARKHLRGGSHVKQYQRINVALSRAQELLIIVGSEKTYRDALIDLPGMNGGPARKVPVYRQIYELVTRFGGRRYAKQLLT